MKTYVVAWGVMHTLITAVAIEHDPNRWCSFLLGAVAIFVFIPFVMAAAISVVSGLLAAILLSIAIVFGRGRPTGVGDVLRELATIGPPIVPGYFRVLSTVRSPRLWGCVTGAITATAHLLIYLRVAP